MYYLISLQVTPDQVIHAPTPARLLTEFHDKHVLVVGQEHRAEIAKEYPFKSKYLCLNLKKNKKIFLSNEKKTKKKKTLKKPKKNNI
jgi:hypothetical protein